MEQWLNEILGGNPVPMPQMPHGLAWCPGRRGERLATNRLRHGTAQATVLFTKLQLCCATADDDILVD